MCGDMEVWNTLLHFTMLWIQISTHRLERVNITRGDERLDPRPFSVLHSLPSRLDVSLVASREPADHGDISVSHGFGYVLTASKSSLEAPRSRREVELLFGGKGASILAIKEACNAEILIGGAKGPPDKIFVIGPVKEVRKAEAILRGRMIDY